MPSLTSPYFSLSFADSPATITFTIMLYGDEVTTTQMPFIRQMLKKDLPTIFRSKCFNEENIPFYKEVISTELGHLFEHILLEYLCLAKINTGFSEATFSGMTRWNWNRDPYGTFHIEIGIDEQDKVFLTQALSKTMTLFQKILLYPRTQIVTLHPAQQILSSRME